MQEKFNSLVDKFVGSGIDIYHLGVLDKGEIYIHSFKEGLCDIRSITKTVMALVVGRLQALGYDINEETYIYPYIKDLGEVSDVNKWGRVQVKHLLTHSVGFDKVLLMRGDIKDKDPYSLVSYLLEQDLVYEPGEYYLYSNAGYYLLSVVLQELLESNLLEFMDEEFFKPLGITNYKYEYYGNYLAGATRLHLLPEDLLKLGELCLSDGYLNGVSFTYKNWLNYMKKPFVRTPKLERSDLLFTRYGYGHSLWLTRDKDLYFAKGTDGQNFVVDEKNKRLIVTLSKHKNLDEIDVLIDEFIRK